MKDRGEQVTKDLLEFVGIPSYHGNATAVLDAHAYLGERLLEVGFDVEHLGTPASPYLVGRLAGDPGRVLVVYLMYDVRAPTAIPPGSPGIRRLPKLGEVLWSPVPIGNKVATLTFLAALADHQAGSRQPSVVVLAEGAETLGSPGLQEFVRSRSELFQKAVGAFWPRESQDAAGRAHLHLGYRGMLGIRLRVSGARFGHGPSGMAVHSQYRPWVDAPTWRLVQALTSLKDADGWGSIQPRSLGDWSEVLSAYDPAGVLGELGVRGEVSDSPVTLLERLEYRASLNLEFEAALSAGVGQIQPAATARLQFRLPPGVECRVIVDRVRRELTAAGFGDAETEVTYAMDGALTDPSGSLIRALERVYEHFRIPVVRWPVALSTSPIVTFQSQLGIAVADGGIGRLHPVSGGEAVVIRRGASESLQDRIEFYARTLRLLDN